jgi:hypothetical protein
LLDDGGVMATFDEMLRSKIQTAILFCNRLANPKPKVVKAEIQALLTQKISVSKLFIP